MRVTSCESKLLLSTAFCLMPSENIDFFFLEAAFMLLSVSSSSSFPRSYCTLHSPPPHTKHRRKQQVCKVGFYEAGLYEAGVT